MRDSGLPAPPLGATTLPIMIALPLPPRIREGRGGHEFKISLAAFGVKP